MRFKPLRLQDLAFMPEEARPRLCEDTRGIVAEDGDTIVAICVLDSWFFSSCQIHIWIDNPFVLKHGFAEEVFAYVLGAGRTKLIGVTPADDKKALKFIKHIGFTEVCRIEDGYQAGVDYVISEMQLGLKEGTTPA